MRIRYLQVFLLLVMASAFVFSGCPAADAKSGTTKKAEKKTSDEKIRDSIAAKLKKKKKVILYFYAERIKNSRDNLGKVKTLAKKHKAEVITIEAEEEEALRYDYGVEYVPTIFVLRPQMGITHAQVVDLNEKALTQALGKKYTPPKGIKAINSAVKKKQPALVFFMADWCGYCQRIQPEVDQFKNRYGSKVKVVTANIEIAGEIGNSYLIEGVPVLVALDKNGAVYRRINYQPNAFQEFVRVFKELGAIK